MRNSQMSNQPTMHWVLVVDAHGRARLEAHWECAAAQAAPQASTTPAMPPVETLAALISHAA